MAAIGAGFAIWATAAVAEPQAAPATLTLDRVFASPDLAGDQPQALRLSPDGTLLTSVRPREDERNRFDLWAMDTRTGTSRMLVDSKKIGSGAELSEAEKMQRERDRSKTGKTGILDYDWAPDGQSILVPIDGELFVAALEGKVRKLNGTKGALNPVISARGGHVSFVRDQNLWVGAGDNAVRAITVGGAGPFRRSGVRRAGRDVTPHRLLVVARRPTDRSGAFRRGAGPDLYPCVDRRDGNEHLSAALSRRRHAQRAGRSLHHEA